MKYKVREHFFLHMDGQVHEPGSVLDLNEEQVERYAGQIEPAEQPKPARKVKADAAE